VRKALSTPARQIAVNAGEDGSIVVGKISDNDTYACGYGAQEAECGDLVSKGIIDPTKVVRTALQDAASIAGLLMTTEAMVAEKPKKETPMPGMPRPEGAWTTSTVESREARTMLRAFLLFWTFLRKPPRSAAMSPC
jgi:chaperonin GroEL